MVLPYYVGEDEYKYIDTFSKKWIVQHKLYLSGPNYCKYCKSDGMLDDIFIGYCIDCAIIIFCGERGQGIKKGYTMDEWRYWLKLPDYLLCYENIIIRYLYDRIYDENINILDLTSTKPYLESELYLHSCSELEYNEFTNKWYNGTEYDYYEK